MNPYTKKLLESFDDFAVEKLDKDLIELNARIDNKIAKGVDYKKDAIEHKKTVELRKQIMIGV